MQSKKLLACVFVLSLVAACGAGDPVLTSSIYNDEEMVITFEPAGTPDPDACVVTTNCVAASFAEGTSVTVTVTGGFFKEWAGDCSGTERTTVVVMDENKQCNPVRCFPGLDGCL